MANNLPTVTSPLPPDLQQFILRVREALDGGGPDAVVTARKLFAANIAAPTPTGDIAPVTGTIETPRAPTGLTASAALASVILNWDSPNYKGHSYTEIWAQPEIDPSGNTITRSSSTIGDATLVGMTSGNNFSHLIGKGGTSSYQFYWIRFVNQNGVAGPFNETLGLLAGVTEDPAYLLQVLSNNLGTPESGEPFFKIDTPTVINGVTIPAGIYIKTAFISDASITNAKIKDLTADKITASLLNTVDFYGNTIAGTDIYLGGTVNYVQDPGGSNVGIASVSTPAVALTTSGTSGMASFHTDSFSITNTGTGQSTTAFRTVGNNVYIEQAYIEDGTITNAKIGNTIQSSNYSSGTTGWKIDKTGQIEANDATFRGTLDVANASSGSRLKITSTKIEVFDGSTLRVKIGDLS